MVGFLGVGAGLELSNAGASPTPKEVNPGFTEKVLNDLARSQGKGNAKDPLMAWTSECLEKLDEKASYDDTTGMMQFNGDPSQIIMCFDQLKAKR